jgi:hypothetical protein
VVTPLLAGLGYWGSPLPSTASTSRRQACAQDGTLKPTQQGIAIAKDSWMTAIGAALVLDSLTPRRRR